MGGFAVCTLCKGVVFERIHGRKEMYKRVYGTLD